MRRKLDDDDDPWDVGTEVYYRYNGKWQYGEIIAYFARAYTIKWSDGSESTYSYDDDTVDTMVDFDDVLWPVGTNVYRKFDDGWTKGSVTDIDENDGGAYTITWEDGDVDVDKYDDKEIDDIVHNYQTMVDGSVWPPGTNLYYEEDDGTYSAG